MKKKWKSPREFVEDCPNCGNEIEAPAQPGEIRKCPHCRRRYVVRFEKRNRRYLEAYIKIAQESGAEAEDGGNGKNGVHEAKGQQNEA